MRLAGYALGVLAAGVAAGIIAFLFADSTDAPPVVEGRPTPAASVSPSPTPLPATWLAAVKPLYGDSTPQLISCLDNNNDRRIDAGDGFGGVDIVLDPATACADPAKHADFYAGAPSEAGAFACAQGARPLLIVAVASAGSDLLDPTEGESLGLIDIINQLQGAAAESGTATQLMISTAAVFGVAAMPQTSMERWMEAELERRLAASPCLRAVLIGHSHGGVAVTSVTAALDSAYADRMLGVLLDRTVALYDRPASEMPSRTQLLNFFQTSEGWHGERIDAANVVNFDESGELAPVAPSDGGGGAALVSHKTLDDSLGVQMRVVDAVMAWVSR